MLRALSLQPQNTHTDPTPTPSLPSLPWSGRTKGPEGPGKAQAGRCCPQAPQSWWHSPVPTKKGRPAQKERLWEGGRQPRPNSQPAAEQAQERGPRAQAQPSPLPLLANCQSQCWGVYPEAGRYLRTEVPQPRPRQIPDRALKCASDPGKWYSAQGREGADTQGRGRKKKGTVSVLH